MNFSRSDDHVPIQKTMGQFQWVFIFAGIIILVAMLLPAIEQVRSAARKTQSANNLRQLALGALNYESAHMKFPSASMKLNGSDVEHGWEIELLPFLESNNLRSRIDFYQPWNSFHNDYLFAKEFPLFLNPSEPKKFDKDGFPLAHYAANNQIISFDTEPKNSDSTVGQDVLFGEVCVGYMPWGKPGNARSILNGIQFDAASFGNPYFQGATFAYADGSAGFVESKLPRPKFGTPTAFEHRPFSFGESPYLKGFSCNAEYSPLLKGNIIFFGIHTGRSKDRLYFPEGDSISDSGLEKLITLPNLRGVDLGISSAVTENGIKTLSNLNELAYLSLGDVVITDAGLLQLHNLKNLQELALIDSECSSTAIKMFQQSNPDCKVRFLDLE